MARIDDVLETVEQLAQSTYAAFKLDVCVVNAEKKIIATSDNLQFKYNTYIVNNGLISRFIFEEGRTSFIVSTPGINEVCKGCDKFTKDCIYKNVVASGIYCNDQLKGVIYISATNTEQAQYINDNEQNLLTFLKKISSLLSAKIREAETMLSIKAHSAVMQKIYDTLNKGVITTSEDGLIISVNNYLKKIFKMDDAQFVGQNITKFFSNMSLETSGESRDSLTEVHATVNGKNRYFLYVMYLIQRDELKNIRVFFIEDSREINQISYEVNEKSNVITLNDIVSNDPSVQELKRIVKTISRTDSTVLLSGETGTGKELFARSIHYESPRKNKPFIAINCGAVPENLIESELFGYEKGAFSGADKHGKHGKFHYADKGTVFLDEVETMSLFMQQKLLRAIERKEIERIGSSICIPLDIRIIAATNVDLGKLVERGEFRQDLFHRLNVIGLFIPPLRERGHDSIFLAKYFIDSYNEKYEKNILGLSNGAKDLFLQYDWKGNIRELQNAIEYCFNLKANGLIEIDDLPIGIQKKRQPPLDYAQDNAIISLSTLEKQHIIRALSRYGSSDKSIIEAGRALGLSRSTMYRKIKKYGIRLSGEP